MNRRTTAEWMAASVCLALVIALLAQAEADPGIELSVALRATARWSFVLFWLASTGGALVTLFGSRFLSLAKRGRDFGLSFASAHLVHLGLVAWLLYIATEPFPRLPLIVFGVGVFWTYLLALLSVRRVSAMLNPRIWRLIRTIGVEYISLAFLLDFVKNPFHDGVLKLIAYAPFQALAVAGPFLRLAAVAKRLTQSWKLRHSPRIAA